MHEQLFGISNEKMPTEIQKKNKLGAKYACGVVISLALKLCCAAETIQCITPPKPGDNIWVLCVTDIQFA